MPIDHRIAGVTGRIAQRSRKSRADYLVRIGCAAESGVARSHLSCGNQAHAFAAAGQDQLRLAHGQAPNLGIITAYNDMLSAHQPFADFPALIKKTAREVGATAQVAGGVPAMCDGVTQGQPGMELSLFSRDVIALAAGVALSHNAFDAALYLGVCDKIVPGLVIAAATFGHIPAIFLPAGPMTSGLPNDEKAMVRQKFAVGEASRKELMEAEMASYHGPGTCTFYGTANSNQMLMEFMGLHLPGSSFVNPGTALRDALTAAGTRQALEITALGNRYRPVGEILDEKAYVNGIVGLMATGGSTNLVMHLIAMARASGVLLELEDFANISDAVPLMARVYPNGLADVNQFHAAGGLGFLIGELLDAKLLHQDVKTTVGEDLRDFTREPKLTDGGLAWQPAEGKSLNRRILRPFNDPFSSSGGLRILHGNLGLGIIKTSAVDARFHCIEAGAKVFHDQGSVRKAFLAGDLDRDVVVVVRFQGPKANGMPELHALTPTLSVLLGRGFRVALVTDGRMSGASGKVPAAIHLSPEAADGGLLARIQDGDLIRLDSLNGTIDVFADGIEDRQSAMPPRAEEGMGRELFHAFRKNVGPSAEGAALAV